MNASSLASYGVTTWKSDTVMFNLVVDTGATILVGTVGNVVTRVVVVINEVL